MSQRRVNARALRQIDENYDHIARDDALAAHRVIDRIHKIIDLIAERPLLGRRTREAGVRTYSTDPYPYVVFYRYSVRRDEVHVIRIRHAAMRRAGLQDESAEFRAAAIS